MPVGAGVTLFEVTGDGRYLDQAQALIAVLDPSGFDIGIRRSWEEALASVEESGGKPYAIPAGASDHPLGGLGFARWANEVAAQERELGYLDLPQEMMVDQRDVNQIPDSERCIEANRIDERELGQWRRLASVDAFHPLSGLEEDGTPLYAYAHKYSGWRRESTPPAVELLHQRCSGTAT